jgi:hypothetical protein
MRLENWNTLSKGEKIHNGRDYKSYGPDILPAFVNVQQLKIFDVDGWNAEDIAIVQPLLSVASQLDSLTLKGITMFDSGALSDLVRNAQMNCLRLVSSLPQPVSAPDLGELRAHFPLFRGAPRVLEYLHFETNVCQAIHLLRWVKCGILDLKKLYNLSIRWRGVSRGGSDASALDAVDSVIATELSELLRSTAATIRMLRLAMGRTLWPGQELEKNIFKGITSVPTTTIMDAHPLLSLGRCLGCAISAHTC